MKNIWGEVNAVFQLSLGYPGDLQLAVPVERDIVGCGMAVALGVDGDGEGGRTRLAASDTEKEGRDLVKKSGFVPQP